MQIISSNQPSALNGVLGGKAEGLLFLQKNGFRVPRFFLLQPDVVAALLADQAVARDLLDNWKKQFQIPDHSLWALRSSAGVEDGKQHSYAGLFHTEINVAPPDMEVALQSVLNAFEHTATLNYGEKTEFPCTIVLQEMLRPEISGVLFSQNPIDASDKSVHLNLIPGLGILLVSGQEEAFMAINHRGKWQFPNEEDAFSGQIFTDKIERIQFAGAEIRRTIEPHLKALLDGARQLERLKQHPVDVEFALANGLLYWLQMRPITTGQKLEKRVWDNGNIGDNFPGLTLPLSISITRHNYSRAYTAMSAFLGMSSRQLLANKDLLGNMVGSIHGAMYYQLTAWQQLLYQLPFGKKTSKLMPKLLHMESADFQKPAQKAGLLSYLRFLYKLFGALIFFGKHKKRFENRYYEVLGQYEKADFSGKSRDQIKAIFTDLDNRLTAHWMTPVLSGFFAMLYFSSLKWIFGRSRLQETQPNFINDILYNQGDVISVQIVRDFRRLQEAITSDAALKHYFLLQTPETMLVRLPYDFPVFYAQFAAYLEQFGARCDQGELKIETRDYQENPAALLEILQSGAAIAQQVRMDKNAEPLPDYRKTLALAYRWSPLRRWLLLGLIRLTLRRVRDRENYRFLRTRGFAVLRRLFRSADAALLRQREIAAVGDSLYLHLDEIFAEDTGEFKNLIRERKQAYDGYQGMERPVRYIQEGDRFSPVVATAQDSADAQFTGIGCSSGVVEGQVVIITEENAGISPPPGCILVAKYFEPGWINLFAHAAGVISERGNLLSHTAILCREMGIPAIVGVKGITSAVKTGDKIRMDGGLGVGCQESGIR